MRIARILPILVLLSACAPVGKQFQPQSEEVVLAQTNDTQDDAPQGDDVADNPAGDQADDQTIDQIDDTASDPQPPVIEDTTLTTGMGELISKLLTKDSQTVTYSYELKIPYQRVYKIASQVTRQLAPHACSFAGGIEKSPVRSYAKGEIPCGRIMNSDWKRLLSVPVQSYNSVEGGAQVFVQGFEFPVYVSRAARSGSYSESNLDSKRTVKKKSSKKFGEDVSVRYTPAGSQAKLEVCLNIPGGEITGPNQLIYAKAKKKLAGIKFAYDSKFLVAPGQATYDYGRGCFSTNFGWSGQNLAPEVSFKVTKKPYLSNVHYDGLHIRIKDWFLRLADRIMAFFKSSLRKKLIVKATNKANKIADQDIETGAWFTRIHADELLAKTGDKLNRRMAKMLTRTGIPATQHDLKVLLQDQCRQARFSGTSIWTKRLEDLCTNLLDQIQVTVQPFAVDAASQAAGCYKHFANIHQSSGKWWGKKCHFSARFAVQLPAAIADFAKEVQQLLRAHIDQNGIPSDWRKELAELKVDDYTLALLLEELENRGYRQIVRSDWSRRIPDVLEDVQAKLAGE